MAYLDKIADKITYINELVGAIENYFVGFYGEEYKNYYNVDLGFTIAQEYIEKKDLELKKL